MHKGLFELNLHSARIIYNRQMQGQALPSKLRILAISDTHVNHNSIDISFWPEADVFVHAGDFTITSTRQEFADFREFLKRLPYKHKLVVAGNHDFGLEPSQQRYEKIAESWEVPMSERVDTAKEIEKLRSVCTLLQHESVEIEGVTFFGTPHVWIGYSMGFIAPEAKNEEVWRGLPAKTDVLVTHIPPFGILDQAVGKRKVGCKRLLATVERIAPKVHIFGHIHESYGHHVTDKTHFYNASYLNEIYNPKNQPFLIEVEIPRKTNP